MSINRKNKPFRKVRGIDDLLSDTPSFDPGFDFQLAEGCSGFAQARAIIERMSAAGYEDIDIIIQLHEEVPQEIAEKALAECRARGIL